MFPLILFNKMKNFSTQRKFNELQNHFNFTNVEETNNSSSKVDSYQKFKGNVFECYLAKDIGLSYNSFLQLIAAAAHFYLPSPYLSLATRCEEFLKEKLLSIQKYGKKRDNKINIERPIFTAAKVFKLVHIYFLFSIYTEKFYACTFRVFISSRIEILFLRYNIEPPPTV